MSKLNELQLLSIGHLLSGLAISEICKALKIPRKDFMGWLEDSDYKAALRQASLALQDATMARLISLNEDALNQLGMILTESSDRNKLVAIKMILDYSTKWLESDLIARIDKLESKLDLILGD